MKQAEEDMRQHKEEQQILEQQSARKYEIATPGLNDTPRRLPSRFGL